jgi:hypothetical protein
MQVHKQTTESCGNDGAMESVESQKQASPSFHSPLEISPKAVEIPTFPQLRRRRDGKVEKQKQLSHFPTAFSLSLPNNRRAGFALRPPRGTFYSARLGIFLFGFDNDVKYPTMKPTAIPVNTARGAKRF